MAAGAAPHAGLPHRPIRPTIPGPTNQAARVPRPLMDPDADPDPHIALIQRISAVPAILQILCETTGLGFAAVAHVTEHSWTACAVLDRIGFGLRPGGTLDLKTTFCDSIRASRQPIVIDQASADPIYATHP